MSVLLKQHLNTHKQQLRTLGLQIIIHHTHAPVHKQSHRLTVTLLCFALLCFALLCFAGNVECATLSLKQALHM
jgi:hypothetical protein